MPMSQTAVPDGSARSSGSRVRLPVSVTRLMFIEDPPCRGRALLGASNRRRTYAARRTAPKVLPSWTYPDQGDTMQIKIKPGTAPRPLDPAAVKPAGLTIVPDPRVRELRTMN